MKEQLDCNLARKHAAVVRRVVARHLERIAKLEASGFSTVRAEQALEVSSLAKNFAQLSLPFWLNLGALGQLWLFDFAKSPLVLLCAV